MSFRSIEGFEELQHVTGTQAAMTGRLERGKVWKICRMREGRQHAQQRNWFQMFTFILCRHKAFIS